MEEKETLLPLTTLYGGLLLHEALLVALYVDRIRFDTELRRIIQSGEQSLAIFGKDVDRYIAMCPTSDEMRQDARGRIAGFFREVEDALKRTPDKRDAEVEIGDRSQE